MNASKPTLIILLAAFCLCVSAALKQEMRTFQGKLHDVNESKLCVSVPPALTNGSLYFAKITSINPKNGKMSVLITLSADARDKQFDEWHNQTVLILNHPKWKQLAVGRKLETDRYFNLGEISVTNSAGAIKKMQAFDFGTPVDK
jgi:hypothetical protein